MRFRGDRVVIGIAAIIALAVIVVSIAHVMHGQSQAAASHAGAAGGSSAPASASANTPSTGTSQTGSSSPITSGPSVPATASTSLAKAVQSFTQTYYQITPGDTEASRRTRVTATGLVAPAAMQMLQFSLTPNQVEYQHYGFTQHAKVDPRTVTASPADTAATTYLVSVPVGISWTDQSGKIISGDITYAISTWQYQGDKWVMTDFSPEGGG